MNSKQTMQTILAGAAVALVMVPVQAQRSTGRATTTGGAMFNYGIGYNYGVSGSNLLTGNSLSTSNGFGVTRSASNSAVRSNGLIIGSGGARIVPGTGNGVVVSGTGYYNGYAYPGGYFYGAPSAYNFTPAGYVPGYGYNFEAIGPVGGYDGTNAAASGQGIDTVGGPPTGVFVPGTNGQVNGQVANDGVPMAQTISGTLLMTREGNGRVRLTWNGDTSLVSRVYIALLDRNKQAISQKELTSSPASARFVRSPLAKYAGVIVDFVDGTRSTTINPLQ